MGVVKNPDLDVDVVRALFAYDRQTGILTRKVATHGRGGELPIGSAVGTVDPQTGYLRTTVNGKRVALHRLIWFMETGKWPVALIDHRNRKKTENWWDNLREAGHGPNSMNREPAANNLSGVRGVHFDKARGKWRADIKVCGKLKMLGRHDTKESAVLARRTAEPMVFGEFAPA